MAFEILKKRQAENFSKIENIKAVTPSKIGIFDLTYDIDSQKLITDIHKFRSEKPKSMHEDENSRTNVSAWHSHYFTHETTDILDDLINVKIEKIKKFLLPSCNPTVKDIWINMYQKGDFAKRHNHDMFYISTVYYPHVDGKTTPLIFDNNDYDNYTEYEIYPKTGMLLVFHSLLYHRVPKCMEEKIRISIAGNFNANYLAPPKHFY